MTGSARIDFWGACALAADPPTRKSTLIITASQQSNPPDVVGEAGL